VNGVTKYLAKNRKFVFRIINRLSDLFTTRVDQWRATGHLASQDEFVRNVVQGSLIPERPRKSGRVGNPRLIIDESWVVQVTGVCERLKLAQSKAQQFHKFQQAQLPDSGHFTAISLIVTQSLYMGKLTIGW
jgi:hypothetical protein